MTLTTRENLEYFAKLKGIPDDLREKLIVKIIEEMNIGEYEHIQAGQLSGGNKRKLTVALALLGNPPIVLLDEPSTGVDPQAKRFMWQVIQKICKKNQNTAVMLTTHSMEEAENLCNYMAIMIAGNFVCFGTPLELKDEFGKGYEIQVNIPIPLPEDEKDFLSKYNEAPESKLNRDQTLELLKKTDKADLVKHFCKEGVAAHIEAEFSRGRQIRAGVVANFILIEDVVKKIVEDLVKEYGEVKIPEHIGNFIKFRVEKKHDYHTIGHLFGKMQDIIEKYKITQYSASQTSLAQIFQTFARQAEVFTHNNNDIERCKNRKRRSD